MTALTTPTTKIIRVGVVGIGNWARHGHLRVLRLLPQYRLSVIYSQRAEAAKTAATEYGFAHIAKTLDELVNHPEVDLVIVLTTAPQHAEAIRAAIDAGKDVYCEWPLTTKTETSEALTALAEQRGVRTLTGLQRRLAPHNRYLKDLIADGFVGKLRSARMHVSMNYFQADLPQVLRWTVPAENFSSMVAIYAGHFLDMLFEGIGWPDAVSALAVNQFPTVTIIETGEKMAATNADQFILSATFPGGAVASIHFEGGKRNGAGVQIDITGTEGDLRITNTSAFGDIGDDYLISGAHGDQLDLTRMPVPGKYQLAIADSSSNAPTLPSAVFELAAIYDAFANDVTSGTHTAPTFADAIRMHKLIDTATRSALEGVRLPFGH